MKTTLTVTAAVITLLACGFGGPKSDNGGDKQPPNPPPVTEATKQRESPTPAQSTERAGGGSVTTTFRGTSGTDRVACGAINTEFMVEAYNGWIEWTAVPVGTDPTFTNPGTPVSTVTVTPASGKLENGQKALVKVRGTYTGTNKKFYIRVQEVVGGSKTMNGVSFTC